MGAAHPDEDVEFGGIAQLVERVVRNDEAWGSNPHTSSLRSQGSAKRRLSRRSLSEGGPFDTGLAAASIFHDIFRF